jgi:hypothetical protein
MTTCKRGHPLSNGAICEVCAAVDSTGVAAELHKRTRAVESDLPPILRRLALAPPHKKQEWRER